MWSRVCIRFECFVVDSLKWLVWCWWWDVALKSLLYHAMCNIEFRFWLKSSSKVIKCKPIPNWVRYWAYTIRTLTSQTTFGRTKTVFSVLNSNYQQKCEEELKMQVKNLHEMQFQRKCYPKSFSSTLQSRTAFSQLLSNH